MRFFSPFKIPIILTSLIGIGKGIIASLLLRPNATVIAAIRDLSNSSDISSLPAGSGSKLIIVKVDATSPVDASAAIESLKSQGITHIDVLIANSGLLDQWGPVSKVDAQDLRNHIEVNTIAPILLFQAAFPLLEKSANPKFFVVSTNIASLELMPHIPLPTIAYGMSKAAINYAVKKIHHENPSISAVVLHPGWVQTRMGQHAADLAGVDEVPVTIEQSVNGLLEQIDVTSKETLSGKFVGFDGNIIPW